MISIEFKIFCRLEIVNKSFKLTEEEYQLLN